LLSLKKREKYIDRQSSVSLIYQLAVRSWIEVKFFLVV
jgi:hypothetical protein